MDLSKYSMEYCSKEIITPTESVYYIGENQALVYLVLWAQWSWKYAMVLSFGLKVDWNRQLKPFTSFSIFRCS